MKLLDRTGSRYGRLVVVRRAPNVGAKVAWLCRCDCGGERVAQGSSLTAGLTRSCGCLQNEPRPQRRDTAPTYIAAHKRVHRLRGKASARTCVDCPRAAHQWSYDHTDPDELVSPEGAPYSTKAEHYAPRCGSCHQKFDGEHRAAASTALEGAAS